MVKSVIYTLVAIALCLALFLGTHFFLKGQFGEFNAALDELYKKTENHQVNREDGYAIKSMWKNKKSKLQVFVPHNDISYIDYWLNEACGLIYTQNYDLALGKIEVLKEITESLPSSYGISLENVF